MRFTRRIGVVLAAALLAMGVVLGSPGAASADVACPSFASSKGQCINTQVQVGGASYGADWYLPDGTASGLMVLEHGFVRECISTRELATSIMEAGLMVLCINADMTGGNPALAATLGDVMTARALTPPAGRALPANYVVGGHSMGGHFASALGARLSDNGYAGFKGAILFDGVAAGGFTDNLHRISAGGTRKVLAIAARPSAWNSLNNSFGALTSLPNGFVGIQLVWSGYFLGIPYGGSCHTDAEGSDDLLANIATGCTPSSFNTGKLREFASVWARDMVTGTTSSFYWCANKADINTCGSKVKEIAGGWLPRSALIR
jgi:pimeloyl-ACP methyl ester carboxylesterase